MSRDLPARVRYVPPSLAQRGPRLNVRNVIGWRAYCPWPRCRFAETYQTHNGAHMAKARHNRKAHV